MKKVIEKNILLNITQNVMKRIQKAVFGIFYVCRNRCVSAIVRMW